MRFLRAGLVALLGHCSMQPAAAAEMVEPGGTPDAAQMALFNPDEFAWRLFFYLSQQAAAGVAGQPDASKASFRNYDPDKDVVWESWALATGQEVFPSRSEVFLRPATKPVAWDDLRKQAVPKFLSAITIKDNPLSSMRGVNIDVLAEAARAMKPMFAPIPELAGLDETRMNRTVFETVRDKELYSIEGIGRRYAEVMADAKSKGINPALSGPLLLVAFEQSAKEVKARWQRLKSEQDKARYHWRSIEVTRGDGSRATEAWGLVALHIITRDVPNWFWTDFGHVDMEPLAWCNRPINPVPETCPRDTTTRGPNAPAGKDGIRTETKGTKWENYILRGTQTNFTDAVGRKWILSNPVIEPPQRSSCISCHARAAVRPQPGGDLDSPGSSFGAVGVPDPATFLPEGEPPYLQVDFLWSIPTRAGNEPSASPAARTIPR